MQAKARPHAPLLIDLHDRKQTADPSRYWAVVIVSMSVVSWVALFGAAGLILRHL